MEVRSSGVGCEKKNGLGGGVCRLFGEGGRRLESQKLKPEGAAWLVFEKKKKCQGWGAAALRKMGEDRFRVFVFFSECVKNAPPLECVEEPSIYRQNVARFFNLVPQLLSFCKF